MRQIRTSDSIRILVVEDDALVRGLIVDVLAEAGYATSEASCAAEALDLFSRRPEIAGEIALVITDVDMPGEIDGIGLAARLKAAWPWLGIVITSGAHRAEIQMLCPWAVFLAKPFRADSLVTTVRSVIDADEASHRRAS